MTAELCDAFAGVLSYPTDRIPGAVHALQRLAGGCRPDREDQQADERVRICVSRFAEETTDMTVGDLEELYTRTFDINPITSLEIGWHLYGEAYERGAFLVKMRGLLRRHGIQESAELPDHLTHALRLLGRLEDAEADAFAQQCVLPALHKMLDGFSGHPSPYGNILQAIATSLEQLHVQGVTSHG